MSHFRFGRVVCWLLILAVAALGVSRAEDGETLHPKLAGLRPFLGKTWRGELTESANAKTVIDVARWERALNGQMVRVLHSINDGEYGGETIIFWDEERQVLAYHYYTTAGFRTVGTMLYEAGRFTSVEEVKGDASGITEVRATSELRPDGTMATSAQYLRKGGWEAGHSAIYREAPEAQVVFR